MNGERRPALCIDNEVGKLERVVIGLGAPYQHDKGKVAREMAEFPFVPDTERKAEVLALTYPSEQILLREFADYVALLQKHDVEVKRADPGAAYSFDYTCPRDIGFVIGDLFFIANMAVPSRADEFRTIEGQLDAVDREKIVRPPAECLLEGGDVVQLDERTVLAGYNLRSNRRGCEFLRDYLAPMGYRVFPVRHSRLHLDCCLNPLGLGHLLIHPQSLEGNDEDCWRLLRAFDWIHVDAVEREHLATNVLSIDPRTVIARTHPACARVNRALESAGYRVEAIDFDGVPATGGSFRCASLPLSRS